MTFGVPYQGSKNKIVPWVLHHLPAAESFVDLFAGGCAVTHGAMLSGLAGYAPEKIFLHEKWAKR